MGIDDSTCIDCAPPVAGHAPNVRLQVIHGPGAGHSILLRRAASIIGSGRQCKVRLKHAEVSNVHAVIVNTGDAIYIRDLVSDTGTFLNDLRAEHERIDDDDVLRIGPWHLQVAIVAPPAGDMGDFTGLGLDPSPSAIALDNRSTGEVVRLPRDVNLLGRRPGCDYFIDERSVSRAHAVMFNYLSYIAVYDLASRNGIKVNGRPCTFAVVKNDDKLTLGSVELNVRLIDPTARVQQASGNGQVMRPKPARAAEDTLSDQIDLGSAEIEKR